MTRRNGIASGLLLVLAFVLTGCDEGAARADLPPEGTPFIAISHGTSEWGGATTQYFANDVVVMTSWEGVGQGEVVTVSDARPGTYERAAAFLAREGPRAQARQGAASICPGSAEGIAAMPAVGGFEWMGPGCGEDSRPFETLREGLTAVLRGA